MEFIAMPEYISVYNGCNERCDMLFGPCACGILHKVEDWKDSEREGREEVIKFINRIMK